MRSRRRYGPPRSVEGARPSRVCRALRGDESNAAKISPNGLGLAERGRRRYILLGGVNDADADADRLARLLVADDGAHRFGAGRAMVNLIAYNPTPGAPYARPSENCARWS